jgi:hypothetical protein
MNIYLVAWFLSVEKGRRAVISAPSSRCELLQEKVQAASRSLPSRYTTSRLPPCCVMYTQFNNSKARVPSSHASKSLSINHDWETETNNTEHQCCVSGIRCFFSPWIRDGKNPEPGSGMNIPSRIFFLRNYYQFSGLRILELIDADTDPGSGMEKSRIRDVFFPVPGS